MAEQETMAPEQVAREVARSIFEQDRISQRLDIRVQEVRPGYARLTMSVREDMAGIHERCHGGFSYLLADMVCGYAATSFNVQCLAQSVNMSYVGLAAVGDELTAVATETVAAGRTWIYDIKIDNQDGKPIAVARGQCRTMRGKIVDRLPALRLQSS